MKRGRRCKACLKGRIDPDGYAQDGRPQYRCGNCDQTHTCGHNGYDWDPRTRQTPLKTETPLEATPAGSPVLSVKATPWRLPQREAPGQLPSWKASGRPAP